MTEEADQIVEDLNEDLPEGEETAAVAEPEDDEVVLTLGEETPETDDEPEPESLTEAQKVAFIKLRQQKSQLKRELLKVKASPVVAQPAIVAPPPVVVGPEPTMADKDINYDPDTFADKYRKWSADKAAADAQQRAAQDAQKAQEAEWQSRRALYESQKASLKVRDFAVAEDVVKASLSVQQQGIILKASGNCAKLVAALGVSPKALAKLAAIKDPVEFTWAAAQMERELKETKRTAPAPDKPIRASGSLAGTTDGTLARLRAEADKTGDRTKVARYLRTQQYKAA